MSIQNIREGEFEKEVLEASMPVCVDFWAEWCEPCRMLSPTIEDLAVEYAGRIKFAKVNIDELPAVAITRRVMSIPTVSLFKDGKEVARMVGVQEKADLKHAFDANLI